MFAHSLSISLSLARGFIKSRHRAETSAENSSVWWRGKCQRLAFHRESPDGPRTHITRRHSYPIAGLGCGGLVKENPRVRSSGGAVHRVQWPDGERRKDWKRRKRRDGGEYIKKLKRRDRGWRNSANIGESRAIVNVDCFIRLTGLRSTEKERKRERERASYFIPPHHPPLSSIRAKLYAVLGLLLESSSSHSPSLFWLVAHEKSISRHIQHHKSSAQLLCRLFF